MTPINISRAIFTTALIFSLSFFGCSDTPDGGDGTGASSGGASGGSTSSGSSGGDCTGPFCLEKEPQIAVSPPKLDFPDVEAGGKPYTIKFRISNTGTNGNLEVTGIKFVPDDGEFSVADFKPASIAPNEVVEFEAAYAPKKAGAKQLVMEIDNNDLDAKDRPFKVPVTVKQATGSLQVTPDPIDFGAVASGKCKDLEAKLFNTGQKPLKILGLSLSNAGSPDFSIKTKPDFDKPVTPGTAALVTLTFCPKPGADKDQTELVVETDDGKLSVILVIGAEIVPIITVVPPSLDFGSLKLGAKGKRSFKIFSNGLAELKVTKMELSPLSKLQSIVLNPSQLKDPLQPKKSKIVEVEATASKAVPNNGSPVASIVLTTNDPAHPKVNVPIFLRTESGKLSVTPPDAVDFAIAAKGVSVERTVHVANQGTSPITVTKVEMLDNSGGEFTLLDDGFDPAKSSPTKHTFQANQYAKFKVVFKPASNSGLAKGKLRIFSDDPDKPQWDLLLAGKRAEGAACNIQMLPGIVNFGMISFGKSKIAQVILKNVGTGYCNFKQMKIRHCPASGFGPLQVPPTCKFLDPLQIWFSTFAPSTKLFAMGPGESGKVQVLFQAPNDAGFFADPKAIQSYAGFIAFEFADQATGTKKWYPKNPNDKNAVPKYTPNLVAKVGRSSVSVLPESVDFGLVTVGCKSKLQHVRVYNTGNIPAYVTKAELQGCGLEVDKVSWPGIPKKGLEVTNAAPVKFGLQYAPQNVGKDSCQMVITTGVEGQCIKANGIPTGNDCKVTAECGGGEWCQGQVFSIPLKGEGTLLDEYTDEFEQGAGKKVDVLFVIDNSGSMGDEQKNLASNFAAFVSVASLWQNDYHIGVTSTDMKGGLKGKLREWNGHRVLTQNTKPSAGDVFKDLAKLGTNGSANEQGLAAAKAALSLPNTFDTCSSKCEKCQSNADCQQNMVCTDDGTGNKACGGANRGFLRKKAGLELVFVSDEEDSSPGSLTAYVDFLKNLKGFANKGLLHAHSIVGTGKNGCKAQKGNRYMTASKETGGKVASICDQSFSKTLKDIGNVAFGLSHQFFLTMTAQPTTLKVWVNGKPCAGPNKSTSWYYEEPSNSVIFVDAQNGGTCMPKKGDKVKIYYKTLCFPKTP